jgi:hypothetical protein
LEISRAELDKVVYLKDKFIMETKKLFLEQTEVFSRYGRTFLIKIATQMEEYSCIKGTVICQ